MEIEYHIEGADSAMIRVRAESSEIRDDIVEAIGRAVIAAETEMKLLAPTGETLKLFGSIHAGPVEFHPGGAGGGGFYEAELSVGEDVPYTRFVVEGTGGKGNKIYPAQGNVLRIQKHGEKDSFVKWITGQDPQSDFIEIPQRIADEIISEAISRI